MQSQTGNVCVRCGKQRVEVRTWKEHIKGAVLTHTSTACPDAECQKIVDRQFAAQKEKRAVVEREREQRAIANKLASQNKSISLK